MRLLARLVSWAGALLLGGVTGVASVVVHQRWWGLVLAVLAVLAVTAALSRGGARLAFAGAWSAVVVRASVPRPEGDYLVPGNVQGYALLLVVPVVLLMAILTFRASRPTPPAPSGL
ncbi:MAG: DUF6113 family protein [Nocardioides sp.]|uniref:DUF6113 family protein n=1 Tax=Nocardioides sp. TaxID=35761 RepID=UPI0039E2D91C